MMMSIDDAFFKGICYRLKVFIGLNLAKITKCPVVHWPLNSLTSSEELVEFLWRSVVEIYSWWFLFVIICTGLEIFVCFPLVKSSATSSEPSAQSGCVSQRQEWGTQAPPWTHVNWEGSQVLEKSLIHHCYMISTRRTSSIITTCQCDIK